MKKNINIHNILSANRFQVLCLLYLLFRENYKKNLNQTNGSIKCSITMFINKFLIYVTWNPNFKNLNVNVKILNVWILEQVFSWLKYYTKLFHAISFLKWEWTEHSFVYHVKWLSPSHPIDGILSKHIRLINYQLCNSFPRPENGRGMNVI